METIAQFHFQTVHFPIALTLTSFFLMITGLLRKSPNLNYAARIVLYLAALGALIAMTTGLLAEEYLPHAHEGAVHDIMEWHEFLGIGIASSLVITAFLSFLAEKKNSAGLQKLVLILMMMITTAVSVTGYLGGRLGHEFGIGIKQEAKAPPPEQEKNEEHHHDHHNEH